MMTASHTIYADVFRPSARQKALAYDMALIVGGSLFIALCAQFSVQIGLVPITGQTLGVLLTGALLGSRRGSLSLIAYLTEGLAGLPVFAPGGAVGLARLTGPTGGYLIGFVAAAYVTGWLAEQGWDRKMETTFLAMIVGNIVIYACGLCWLSGLVGLKNALQMGLYPFLIGDLLKATLAMMMLPTGWKVLRQIKS